jgi:hypothetical protein
VLVAVVIVTEVCTTNCCKRPELAFDSPWTAYTPESVMMSPASSVPVAVAPVTDSAVVETHELAVVDRPRVVPNVSGEPAIVPVVCGGSSVFSPTSKPPVRPIIPSRNCSLRLL